MANHESLGLGFDSRRAVLRPTKHLTADLETRMTFPGLGEPFPERDGDILDLAVRMIEAMERDPETFRDAPYSAAQLRAAVEEARAAIAASNASDQAYREAIRAKEQSLLDLRGALKGRLWSIEVNVRGRPERLSGLGWGGSETTDRVPPGAVRDLTVEASRDTSVVLEWRPPADGGPAAEYRVQRRQPGGPWTDVATAVDNDCLLTDQPEGIELDLRVIPVNQAGIGEPSAAVTLVL